jgi:hypothetical protein
VKMHVRVFVPHAMDAIIIHIMFEEAHNVGKSCKISLSPSRDGNFDHLELSAITYYSMSRLHSLSTLSP